MTTNPHVALGDLIAGIDSARIRNADASDLARAVAAELGTFIHERGTLDERLLRPAPGKRYTQHLLHVSADRGYSIVALVWGPGQCTSIHDHLGWCVVGVYQGCERETRYLLDERDGTPQLVPMGVSELRAGAVTIIADDCNDLHRVENGFDGTTISLHVYGVDVEQTGSSIARKYDDLLIRPA